MDQSRRHYASEQAEPGHFELQTNIDNQIIEIGHAEHPGFQSADRRQYQVIKEVHATLSEAKHPDSDAD